MKYYIDWNDPENYIKSCEVGEKIDGIFFDTKEAAGIHLVETAFGDADRAHDKYCACKRICEKVLVYTKSHVINGVVS